MAIFGINVEERPWYYALGVGVFIAALLAGAVHWFVFKPKQEEIAAKGGNSSLIHIDWMIGPGGVDIDGIKQDGSRVPVMRKGEWA